MHLPSGQYAILKSFNKNTVAGAKEEVFELSRFFNPAPDSRHRYTAGMYQQGNSNNCMSKEKKKAKNCHD